MLSKTDFLTYLEAPMHLWAKAHNPLVTHPPLAYEQCLSLQGQAVEALTQEYLGKIRQTVKEYQ